MGKGPFKCYAVSEIRDRPIDRVDELYARAKQNEKFPVRWSYNLFGPHCPVRINISISVRAVEQANEADRAKRQSRTSFY